MGVRKIQWGLVAVCLLAGSWLATVQRVLPQAGPARPSTEAVAETAQLANLKGTASCSARACHGGLAPATSGPIEQNEFIKWLTTDKHAHAYDVLLEPRSKDIAKNLNPTSKVPAHEDYRCLACHTNPLVASEAARALPNTNLAGRELVAEERRLGVGCEACHGAAQKWFAEHTKESWPKEPAARRYELGMVPTGAAVDLAGFAQRCAGCHVGAPPAGERLPVRDVNHDLIAAGHPRLHFEFGTFLANMPPHWNPKNSKQGTPEFEARVWAVGQVASGHAALELLVYRATPGKDEATSPPWPEFAEYDCFACHHDLSQLMRQKKEHYGPRLPGSFPWGNWYFTVPELLAGQSPDGAKVVDSLNALSLLMSKPYPDRAAAARDAKSAADLFAKWQEQLAGGDLAGLRKVLASAAAPKRGLAYWDVAEQLYLAAAALSEGDKAVQSEVNDLGKKLAFPTGKDFRFDSAKGYQPDQALQDQLSKVLKQLSK
jgi:hypothetical protein